MRHSKGLIKVIILIFLLSTLLSPNLVAISIDNDLEGNVYEVKTDIELEDKVLINENALILGKETEDGSIEIRIEDDLVEIPKEELNALDDNTLWEKVISNLPDNEIEKSNENITKDTKLFGLAKDGSSVEIQLSTNIKLDGFHTESFKYVMIGEFPFFFTKQGFDNFINQTDINFDYENESTPEDEKEVDEEDNVPKENDNEDDKKEDFKELDEENSEVPEGEEEDTIELDEENKQEDSNEKVNDPIKEETATENDELINEAEETEEIRDDLAEKENEHNSNKDEKVSIAIQNFGGYFKALEDVAVYDNRSGSLVEVGKLTAGEIYPRFESSPSWHQIEFGNYKAYVKKEGTEPVENNTDISIKYSNQSKEFTTIENTSVYDYQSGELIGMINADQIYPIAHDYKGEWIYITFAGKQALVKTSSIKKQYFIESDKYFQVATDKVPLYQKLNGKLEVVGSLLEGEEYVRYESSPSWHKIKIADEYYFVSKDNTVPSSGNKINNESYTYSNQFKSIIPKQNISVYDNSSGNLIPYAELKEGYRYKVSNEYGGKWISIHLGDRLGYVDSSQVDLKYEFKPSDTKFMVLEETGVYDNSTGKLVEIGKVKAGQTFEKIPSKSSPQWHFIDFGTRTAYIEASATEPYREALPKHNFNQTNRLFTTKVDTTIYEKSSGSLKPMAEIEKNIPIPVVKDYGGEWVYVLVGNRLGYIKSTNLIRDFNTRDRFFEVIYNELEVFDNSGAKLNKIATLTKGQKYRIIDSSPSWNKIELGSYNAYVKKDGAIPTTESGISNLTRSRTSIGNMTTKQQVTVYDNTGSGSLVPFAVLEKNKSLPIIRDSGNWLEVNVAGRYGYVRKNEVNETIMEAKNLVLPRQEYTYDEMRQDISELVDQYPGLISSETIGKSVDGRNLYSIKIGKGSTKIFLNGSHHAREWLTTNLLMEMVDTYSQAYANDSSVGGYNARDILNKVSIYVVPMVNPDGVTLVQKGAFSAKRPAEVIRINGGSTNFDRWKANIRGVDLNRQYPADWADIQLNRTSPSYMNHKGRFALSEPESRAIYDFTRSHNFKTAVAYHSSGQILYWNYKLRNGTALKSTSRRIANMISSKTGYSLFMPGSNPSGGGFTDWFIQGRNKPGFTPEISPHVGERPVPVSYFDSIWNKNDSIGLMLAKEAYDNRYNR